MRETPTPATIMAALTKPLGHYPGVGRDEDTTTLGTGRVMSMPMAVKILRGALHTTTGTAEKWITELTDTPGSPLVALHIDAKRVEQRNVVRATYVVVDNALITMSAWGATNGAPGVMALDWIEVTNTGDLVRVGTLDLNDHRHHGSNSRLLVTRETLVAKLNELVAETVAYTETQRAKHEAQKQLVRAGFVERYGDVLDVLADVLAPVAGAATDEYSRDVDGLFQFADYDMSRYYGEPGALTLTLYGAQIRAFADLLREVRDGRDVPDVDDD